MNNKGNDNILCIQNIPSSIFIRFFSINFWHHKQEDFPSSSPNLSGRLASEREENKVGMTSE